jgi:hypothetical protein
MVYRWRAAFQWFKHDYVYQLLTLKYSATCCIEIKLLTWRYIAQENRIFCSTANTAKKMFMSVVLRMLVLNIYCLFHITDFSKYFWGNLLMTEITKWAYYTIYSFSCLWSHFLLSCTAPQTCFPDTAILSLFIQVISQGISNFWLEWEGGSMYYVIAMWYLNVHSVYLCICAKQKIKMSV